MRVNMPRLCVVLTHFNDAENLTESVQSILNQRTTDFSLHIADDNTPNRDWLYRLGNLALDSRVHIYQSDQNVGTYRLKNRMISQIDAEYIAFQDSDDISIQNRLCRQLTFLNEHRKVVLLGSAYNELVGTNLHPVKMPFRPKLARLFGHKYLSLHPTWMMRRGLFDALGGFDGTTRIAADDEFMYRALYLGKIRNTQERLYIKRTHSASLTGSTGTGFLSKVRLDYRCALEENLIYLKTLSGKTLLEALKAKQNDIDFKLFQIK